ncbi:metallo-beta-lactamase domain-containing protein 1 isoform X2 [Festucalex cinctus]
MASVADIKKIPLRETQLDFPGKPYSVSVLKVGYSQPQPDGTFRADGTVTLVTAAGNNILVDTGGPWARDFLVESLRKKGLEPGHIQLVVGTHGHSDHVGNLNLFPSAVVIVGHDVSRGDVYRPNEMAQGHAHVLDEHVSDVLQCATKLNGNIGVCGSQPRPQRTGRERPGEGNVGGYRSCGGGPLRLLRRRRHLAGLEFEPRCAGDEPPKGAPHG